MRQASFGGEAIIADELADDGSVLLLDVGTVVLLPGAAARKSDALAPTVAACRIGNTLRR
jgi:hypothetical protein